MRTGSDQEHRPAMRRAFTLLEVMIALGIFFMAVFSILGLVSAVLKNAQHLERPQVDAGLAAAMYVNTNRFFEGTMSGDFGDALRDYTWQVETEEFATNGLLQADVLLLPRRTHEVPDGISILVFDPNFKSGPFANRPGASGGQPAPYGTRQ